MPKLKSKTKPGGISAGNIKEQVIDDQSGELSNSSQQAADFYVNWLDNRRQQLWENMKATNPGIGEGLYSDIRNIVNGYEPGRIAINKEIYKQRDRIRQPIIMRDIVGRLNPNTYGELYEDGTMIDVQPNLHGVQLTSTMLHELSHAANKYRAKNMKGHDVYYENGATSPQELYIQKYSPKLKQLNKQTIDIIKQYPNLYRNLQNEREYLLNPSEYYSRMMEFRFQNKLKPNKLYKKSEIEPLIKRSKISGIDWYDVDDFVKMLNEVAYTNSNNNPYYYG